MPEEVQVLNMYGDFAREFGAKLSVTEFAEVVDEETKMMEKEFEEEDDDENDFSFVCVDPISVISAEDIFQDGKIRPIYLFSDEKSGVSLRPPLKKLFVEEEKEAEAAVAAAAVEEGPYCEWTPAAAVEVTPSRESCKKSSSTGFSRRWRFRDLVQRSNSDGKDAFVFLNAAASPKVNGNEKEKEKKKTATATATATAAKGKVKGKKDTTSLSAAHEKLYGESKAKKEGEKRRSFLPYRQVGFFTNVNGLTRNIHPY